MYQSGDIHVTFKDGLFLIWSHTSNGVWLPTNDSRDASYIEDYLKANRMVKIKDTRPAELESMPLCGIYHSTLGEGL